MNGTWPETNKPDLPLIDECRCIVSAKAILYKNKL